MGAIRARFGTEFRGRWRSLVGLALLIGLTGGIALAGIAGARRTDSAYPRFFAAQGSYHAVVNSCDSGFPVGRVDLARVGALPQVATVAPIWGPVFATVSNAAGHPIWEGLNVQFAMLSGLGTSFRPKIIAGRLPSPDRPSEIALGYLARPGQRVPVGQTIRVRFVTGDIDPTFDAVFDRQGRVREPVLLDPIELHVVGRVAAQGEIVAAGDEQDVYLTPAFEREYGDQLLSCRGVGVRLKNGFDDLPAFTAGVQRIAPGEGTSWYSTDAEAAQVTRSARLQAVVLLLFAGLAALTGLVVVGQALARLAFAEGQENPTLRALGMSRGQLFAIAMLRAAVPALAGTLLALAVALVLSPLFPTGVPGLAEPVPGFALDAVVLGLGAAAIAIGALAVAAVPSWRASSVRGDALGIAKLGPVDHPSRVANRLARAGAPAAAVSGVRMAMEPGRGRTSVPVRSAILAITFAVAALAAGVTFSASFRHLLATPRLYGDTSDLSGGNPVTPDDLSAEVVPSLVRDPRIADLSSANVASLLSIRAGDRYIAANVWGFEPDKGSGVNPTVLEGHWPTAPHQIALGSSTMRRLGVAIGDPVEVVHGGTNERVQVVGRVVFSEAGFAAGLGEGGGMRLDGLRRLLPKAPANIFVIRLAAGVDPGNTVKALQPVFERAGGGIRLPSAGGWRVSLENLRRAEQLPILLAYLIALASLATLVHVLVTSVRRRRRDLALLKTLGFTRRQIRATVAWQATSIALIALAIGLPLGIGMGRSGWLIFADRLGVVPEAVLGGLVLLVAIPITVLLTNLVAAIPGLFAARTQPAIVLRSE